MQSASLWVGLGEGTKPSSRQTAGGRQLLSTVTPQCMRCLYSLYFLLQVQQSSRSRGLSMFNHPQHLVAQQLLEGCCGQRLGSAGMTHTRLTTLALSSRSSSGSAYLPREAVKTTTWHNHDT